MALKLFPNWPLVALQAAFNVAPNSGTGTPAWVDLSTRMNRAWDCQQGRQYELNTVETGEGKWELGNKDEQLNPANLASPYNQAITPAAVQSVAASTGTGSPSYLGVQFTTPAVAGNVILVAVSSNGTIAVPLGYSLIASALSASNGNLYLFQKQAIGGECRVLIVPAGTDAMSAVMVEYSGLAPSLPQVDATSAGVRRNASAGNTIGTGTTAATVQPLELVVSVAAPHNYAAASAPASPVWSSGAVERAGTATTSATSASNCAVFLGDRTVTATGTQSDTCTWTNNTTDAGGLVVTFRAITTLVPYRPVRYWEACRSDGVLPMWSGNFLNDGVNSWNNGWVPSGSLSDTAGFEGGTVGTWSGVGGATVANSAVRAHDGTKSLLVTWPTASSGAAWAAANLPPTRTGVQYTASAWVYVPTGSPPVVLNCNGNTSAASSTTNAWQRLTLTWTATDSIGGLFVITNGASTSGQQVWVDSVQLEAAAAASAWSATGPTVYPVWNGYFERYSETWEHQGFYGWTKTTMVDPLAMLVRVRLADCMTEDALQDQPALYWPLNDNPSDGVPKPRAPFAGHAYSPIVGAITPGATGGPGVDTATCLTFNGTGWIAADLDPSTAHSVRAYFYQYAPIDTGAGMTVECWFQTAAGYNATPCILEAAALLLDSSSPGIDIEMNFQGHIVVEYAGVSTVTYSIVDPGVTNDGAWHYVAVTEQASGGTVTATVYVDNRVAGTATRTGTAALSTSSLTLGSNFYTSGTYTAYFTGKMARAAVYPAALSQARILSHWASAQGFPWDSTGQRATRMLGWAPWRGATAMDTGRSDVAIASGLSGRNASDGVNACAVTENGVLVATPDGVLRFWGRDRYYNKVTNSATFGENVAGGEIPYLGDIGIDTDPQLIYNDVKVTPPSNNAQEVSDSLSERRFGSASGGATTTHRVDGDALALAQHLLRRYKEPQPRPSVVTFDLAANPAIWAQVLGLRFGDRVRVNRRTQAGITTTIDGFIDHMKHGGGPGARTVQVRVSPVDPLPAWIVGDATYGVLGTAPVQY